MVGQGVMLKDAVPGEENLLIKCVIQEDEEYGFRFLKKLVQATDDDGNFIPNRFVQSDELLETIDKENFKKNDFVDLLAVSYIQDMIMKAAFGTEIFLNENRDIDLKRLIQMFTFKLMDNGIFPANVDDENLPKIDLAKIPNPDKAIWGAYYRRVPAEVYERWMTVRMEVVENLYKENDMISFYKTVKYEPKEEVWTQETLIDMYNFLGKNLNFGTPFELLMTADMINLFLTMGNGVITYQEIVGSENQGRIPNTLKMRFGNYEVVVRRVETFKYSPYMVQTFRGFDCREVVIDFSVLDNTFRRLELDVANEPDFEVEKTEEVKETPKPKKPAKKSAKKPTKKKEKK